MYLTNNQAHQTPPVKIPSMKCPKVFMFPPFYSVVLRCMAATRYSFGHRVTFLSGASHSK